MLSVSVFGPKPQGKSIKLLNFSDLLVFQTDNGVWTLRPRRATRFMTCSIQCRPRGCPTQLTVSFHKHSSPHTCCMFKPHHMLQCGPRWQRLRRITQQQRYYINMLTGWAQRSESVMILSRSEQIWWLQNRVNVTICLLFFFCLKACVVENTCVRKFRFICWHARLKEQRVPWVSQSHRTPWLERHEPAECKPRLVSSRKSACEFVKSINFNDCSLFRPSGATFPGGFISVTATKLFTNHGVIDYWSSELQAFGFCVAETNKNKLNVRCLCYRGVGLWGGDQGCLFRSLLRPKRTRSHLAKAICAISINPGAVDLLAC